MSGIKMGVNIDKDTKRGRGDFVDGKYLWLVTSAEEKTSSNGNQMVELELEAVDALEKKCIDGIGRKAFDRIVFTDSSKWKIASFLDAIHHTKFSGDEFPEVMGKFIVAKGTEATYDKSDGTKGKKIEISNYESFLLKKWDGQTRNWRQLQDDETIDDADLDEVAGKELPSETKSSKSQAKPSDDEDVEM